MYPLVARAHDRSMLLHTAAEASALWFLLTRRVGRPVALCLMPDHLHLQHAQDVSGALGSALRAYALWRNALRGQSGPVFKRKPPAHPLATPDKVRRSVRYIHLNPVRAGLVSDPLAWPWSTHRDAVGICLRSVRDVDRDPDRFHRYVSSNPMVALNGTSLPHEPGRVARVDEVLAAVSELTRRPMAHLGRRNAERTLAVAASRALCDATAAEIADAVCMHHRTVRRVAPLPPPPQALRHHRQNHRRPSISRRAGPALVRAGRPRPPQVGQRGGEAPWHMKSIQCQGWHIMSA